jgi:chemotaxis protein CheC
MLLGIVLWDQTRFINLSAMDRAGPRRDLDPDGVVICLMSGIDQRLAVVRRDPRARRNFGVSMSDGHVIPLTELERDALGEVSNIAMARAANSLRQMVHHEVVLSVPSVEIVSQETATRIVGNSDNPKLVAVRQDFSGAFSGRALLIFPEANSLELVRAVVGRDLPLEDIVDLEDEALAETGNIILNSWVATIANLLKQALKVSLPVVVRGESRHMFETVTASTKLILFLHIRFEIRQKEIRGYVALLMDIPSLDELRLLLSEFIGSLTDASASDKANGQARLD